MNLQQRKERDIAAIAAITRVILMIALTAVLGYFGFRIFFFLMPVMIGLILAKASVSSSKWVRKKIFKQKTGLDHFTLTPEKKGRKLAIVFYFLFFVLFGILVFFVISFIIGLIARLGNEIPKLIGSASLIDTLIAQFKNISAPLGGLFDESTIVTIEEALKNLQKSVVESLPQLLAKIAGILTGFFASVPKTILIFVVTIMSGYYFITQTDRLYLWMSRLIPDKMLVRTIIEAASNLTSTLFRIGGGYIALMMLTFVQAYIGMLIFSVPNALIWAVLCALFDILPVLGIAVTLVPMGITFIVGGNIFAGIGILVLYVVMAISRTFIEPAVIGNAMRLHPVIIILAMITGIAVIGIGGILVGPLVCVIGREIFITFELEDKIRNAIGDLLGKNNGEEDANDEKSESSTVEVTETANVSS